MFSTTLCHVFASTCSRRINHTNYDKNRCRRLAETKPHHVHVHVQFTVCDTAILIQTTHGTKVCHYAS